MSRKIFWLVILSYTAATFILSSVDLNHDIDGINGYRFPVHGSDSSGYAIIAKNIYERGVFSSSVQAPFIPDTFRTPVYPLFISLWMYVGGSLFFVILAQIILVALTYLMTVGIAQKMGAGRYSVLAGLLFVLDPIVALSTVTLMSESLFTFLSVAVVYLMLGLSGLTRKKEFFLSSIFAGLAVLVRPSGAYIVLLLAVLFIHEWQFVRKNISFFILTAFVPVFIVAGWMCRNYFVSGVPGLTALSAQNLMISEVPRFLFWRDGMPKEDTILKLTKESGLSEIDMYDIRNSSKMSDVAMPYIRADFANWIKYHLESFPSFFFGSSVRTFANSFNLPGFAERFGLARSDKSLIELLHQKKWGEFFGLAKSQVLFTAERIFWVVIFLLSLIPLLRRDNRLVVLSFWFAIMFVAFTTATIFTPRYRVPVEPFMLILSAVGVRMVIKRILEFKTKV